MKKIKLLALSLALAGLVLPNGMEASNGLGSSDELQSSTGSAFSDSSKTKKSSKRKKKKKANPIIMEEIIPVQHEPEPELMEVPEKVEYTLPIPEQPKLEPETPTPKAPPRPKDEPPLSFAEQPPTFPGGEQALMTWLANNLNYPIGAQERGISGRVIVVFVVEKDGSLSNFEIRGSVDPDLDAEALRVVKKMPKWNPGRMHDKPVRVLYNLPVSFRLK